VSDALVSCAVGDVEYALRADDIIAVMRAERMRAPAACEAGIGVVTVGNERASVYPLGTTVGLSTPENDHKGRDRHIVVLRSANGPVGWLVDRVSRSRLPVHTRVLPLPSLVGASAKRWFAGILSTADRTVLLLSLSPADHHDGSYSADVPESAVRSTSLSTPNTDGPLVVTFSTDALRCPGAARFAVSARRVAGVESGLDVLEVPGSESPVIGVSVWRGEVLPVLDLRDGTEHQEVDRRRLLIVRCGGSLAGTSVAIPVHAETALCQPTQDNPLVDPARVGATPLPPYVVGVFEVRGQTVALIDPDTLVRGAARVTLETQHQMSCSAAGR
jgi:chemotaxis signal transduction protein